MKEVEVEVHLKWITRLVREERSGGQATFTRTPTQLLASTRA